MMEVAVASVGLDPAAMVQAVAQLPHEQFEQAVQVLPPEVQALAVEMHEEMRQARLSALRDLTKKLAEKRDPIVKAKREIEKRWAEDDRQYYGQDRSKIKGDRRQSSDAESDSVPPGLNLTGSRTNIWEARIVNMVCPGSILPGDTQPTPSPEVYGDDGQLIEDPAKAMEVARMRAVGMGKEIRDQFAECHLPREIRKAAKELCRHGTGILGGPYQVIPKRTKFKRLYDPNTGATVYEATRANKPRPAWRHVCDRYFFPEMVGRIEDAGYAFELMLLTKREVSDLRGQPGFEEYGEQFEEILEAEDFKWSVDGDIALNLSNWNDISPCKEAVDARIAVWRFFGYVDAKALEDCCIWHAEQDGQTPPLMEVWFTGDKVLRAETMMPDGTMRLPYYVTKLFDIDDTMFGGGIPHAARDAQSSINGFWRAIQHNAAVSAGPQMGYKDGKAEPVDNDWRVRCPKLWRILEEDATISDVLSVMVIPNVTEPLMRALEMRIQLFDDEINLPLVAQGQPDQATPTSSGLAMQMRAASVAIMNIGQNCEDGWVTPLFESAYHYNMAHSDKEWIKGDYDCVSRLVSDNVMREIKAQNLLALGQFKAQDPDFAMRLKKEVYYPRLAAALEQEADLFHSEDEVKQIAEQMAQNQPQDPAMLKVQVEQQKVQAEAEFAKYDRDMDNAERMEELRVRMFEAETARMKVELEERVQREIAGTNAQLKAATVQAQEETKRQKHGADVRLKAEQMARDEQRDALEVRVEAPNPRLA